VHAAVLAGIGLSVLPDYLVDADLASGRLLHILPAWRLPSGGVHVVFPTTRFRPRKVSAFVELLADHEKRRNEQGGRQKHEHRPARARATKSAKS